MKSKDAGNYRFDPFCEAIEVVLVRKDGKSFENNFMLKGNVKIEKK